MFVRICSYNPYTSGCLGRDMGRKKFTHLEDTIWDWLKAWKDGKTTLTDEQLLEYIRVMMLEA
jgi:hypothetical protein